MNIELRGLGLNGYDFEYSYARTEIYKQIVYLIEDNHVQLRLKNLKYRI